MLACQTGVNEWKHENLNCIKLMQNDTATLKKWHLQHLL